MVFSLNSLWYYIKSAYQYIAVGVIWGTYIYISKQDYECWLILIALDFFKILENKNLFQILGYILNRFLYRGGLPGKF